MYLYAFKDPTGKFMTDANDRPFVFTSRAALHDYIGGASGRVVMLGEQESIVCRVFCTADSPARIAAVKVTREVLGCDLTTAKQIAMDNCFRCSHEPRLKYFDVDVPEGLYGEYCDKMTGIGYIVTRA